MENFVHTVLGIIISVWFINVLIDLLFGINVIGYLKVWLDILVSTKTQSHKHDDDE